jgi:hypothetical protein
VNSGSKKSLRDAFIDETVEVIGTVGIRTIPSLLRTGRQAIGTDLQTIATISPPRNVTARMLRPMAEKAIKDDLSKASADAALCTSQSSWSPAIKQRSRSILPEGINGY